MADFLKSDNKITTFASRYGRRYMAVFTGLAVAATGLALISGSQAAGPFVAAEVEQGTITSPASQNTDASASGGSTVTFGAASSGSLFLNGFFPIGVDVQPEWDGSFAKWKDRGVNTLIRECCGEVNNWAAAASAAGLKQIRSPKSPASADIGDPMLLAWAQTDEPDGIYSQVPWETIQSRYNTWKGIDPNRNVLINFVGAYCPAIGTLCQYDTRTGQGGLDWYKKYVAGADWISADTYPANSGGPVTAIRDMMTGLKGMSGSKPVFAYIETGDFDTTNAYGAPTPDFFRAEVWSAIINGARGIFYFVVRVVPDFQWDVTPAAVATELTKQNGTITQLAPVLQGPINPSGISATVPSALEAGWRSAASGKYFFVLNLMASTQSNQVITLTGTGSTATATVYGESRTVPITAGKITDSFGPYAIHIYQVQ